MGDVRPSAPWVLWCSALASRPGPFADLDSKVLSHLDDIPKLYLVDLGHFVSEAATRDDTAFILLPASGTNVKIVCQCFPFSEVPDGEMLVFGIQGALALSPFKKINVWEAVTPMRIPAVATRKGGDLKIPSLAQFMEVDEADDFVDLAGGDEDDPVSTLTKEPCSFWIHPCLCRCIKGLSGGRAAELGIKIIECLRLLDDEDSQETGSLEEGHRTLVFLWAVKKGLTCAVSLGDLPEAPGLDQKCHQTLRKLLPGGGPDTSGCRSASPAQTATGGGAGGSIGGASSVNTNEMNKALIQNLTALTEKTLESSEREERKKSLKSLLSPEVESLFAPLCTRDWRDKKPRTSLFLKKLLAETQ